MSAPEASQLSRHRVATPIARGLVAAGIIDARPCSASAPGTRGEHDTPASTRHGLPGKRPDNATGKHCLFGNPRWELPATRPGPTVAPATPAGTIAPPRCRGGRACRAPAFAGRGRRRRRDSIKAATSSCAISACCAPMAFTADHSQPHQPAATLDRPEDLQPTFHRNWQSRLPRLEIADALPDHDGTLPHWPRPNRPPTSPPPPLTGPRIFSQPSA